MNIVDLIHQELSGGLLDKLSSYTGQGEMKTKAAAAAAVPVLLSAVGGMASTAPGAERVAAMIRKFTPEEMAALAGMTTGQSAAMFDESKSALTGLIESGQVKPVIDKIYPLSQTIAAIRYMRDGHALGKVVINISDASHR